MSDGIQLFPPLDEAVEAALTESIRRFGVLVPVVRDQNGRTLDGHHRSRIADGLGVSYRVDLMNVEDDEAAYEIARTLNADRRHMDPEQRREVEVALREAGHSLRAIGGAVGVSHEQVRNDLSTVNDLTVPERVTGLDGKSRPTIVAAKNEREAERAQEALASAGDSLPSGRVMDVKRAERIGREAQAEHRRSEPVEPITEGDCQLYVGDFLDVLDLTGEVDAIITDPPYDAESVPLFSALGQFAAQALRPAGVLAALTGQSHLPEYLTLLGHSLTYRWVGAYVVQGPRNRVHYAKVGTGWKPVVLFTRDEGDPWSWLLDDVFVSDADDKEHHHWGQSESGIAALVERLTEPGQLVVDPFLGGGTTAVVCQALGRRFIGCDIDPVAVATTRERVA